MKPKTPYRLEMQFKLASIRRDHYHGSMTSDTYAIYRSAYLMTEEQARRWYGDPEREILGIGSN